jgi:hypothetical protein
MPYLTEADSAILVPMLRGAGHYLYSSICGCARMRRSNETEKQYVNLAGRSRLPLGQSKKREVDIRFTKGFGENVDFA